VAPGEQAIHHDVRGRDNGTDGCSIRSFALRIIRQRGFVPAGDRPIAD
jgi:hypothetical protein